MASETVRIIANDVEVGTLPLRQYRLIRRAVFHDWRIYVLQTTNLVDVVWTFLRRSIGLTPTTFFWLLALYCWLDPNGVTRLGLTANGALPGGPNALPELLSDAFLLAFCLPFAEWVVHGSPHRFVNCFARETNKRVRQALKLPVDADLVIVTEHEDC